MKSLRIRTAPAQLADHLKEEIRAGRWLIDAGGSRAEAGAIRHR